MGGGGVRARPGRGSSDLPFHRVRDLPLVPRHGARVLRGRGRGRAPQPGFRVDQGRPRGTSRHRRRLHDGVPTHDGAGGVAAHDRDDAGQAALLRRDLFPARERGRAGGDAGPAAPACGAVAGAAGGCRGGGSLGAGGHPGGRGPRAGFRRGRAPRGDAPPRFQRPAGPLRPPPGRVLPGSEVPGAAPAPLPPPLERPHRRPARRRDGGEDARLHAAGRRLRPRRVRLPPLLDGCPLARPPLREDAVRPGAARHGVHGAVAGDGRRRAPVGGP